jgi:hypothetical protein
LSQSAGARGYLGLTHLAKWCIRDLFSASTARADVFLPRSNLRTTETADGTNFVSHHSCVTGFLGKYPAQPSRDITLKAGSVFGIDGREISEAGTETPTSGPRRDCEGKLDGRVEQTPESSERQPDLFALVSASQYLRRWASGQMLLGNPLMGNDQRAEDDVVAL